jgi:hypothetical protein
MDRRDHRLLDAKQWSHPGRPAYSAEACLSIWPSLRPDLACAHFAEVLSQFVASDFAEAKQMATSITLVRKHSRDLFDEPLVDLLLCSPRL